MAPNHILLVDDDVQLARSIAELLRRHGYEVALAHQGKAAMKYLATSRVALVISDIFMPDCDGIELLAMSGSSTTRVTGMLKIAAALGAARTLPKPFEPSVLLALVRELIGPATVSAPSPAG
jgi:DNA-binding response OmpR family regulator